MFREEYPRGKCLGGNVLDQNKIVHEPTIIYQPNLRFIENCRARTLNVMSIKLLLIMINFNS